MHNIKVKKNCFTIVISIIIYKHDVDDSIIPLKGFFFWINLLVNNLSTSIAGI